MQKDHCTEEKNTTSNFKIRMNEHSAIDSWSFFAFCFFGVISLPFSAAAASTSVVRWRMLGPMTPLSDFALPLEILFFIVGAVMGSFGNVVVFRSIAGKNLNGRSMCRACGHVLSPLELVPVLSFLFLGAKCRACRMPISWQYPLVEAATGLLFLLSLWQESFILIPAFLLATALWLLLLISLIDARTGSIPDALTIPFIGVSVMRALLLPSLPLLAMLIGGGFFALQWIISRGRWVGSGDMLVGVGIGALVLTGAQTFVSLGIAYIAGAIVAVLLLSTKRRTLGASLPFGPFLAFGALVTVFEGGWIVRLLMGS